MPSVADVAAFLEQFAPRRLAEDWDNVGLLVGRRRQDIRRLMTCLTVTPQSAAEAVDQGAQLIVSHHPMPFLAAKRLTDETTVGRLLLELIGAGVAIYSPHTAFDSAPQGINQRLAEGLGLQSIAPLIPLSNGVESNAMPPHCNGGALGTGRFGSLPTPVSLDELADRLKKFLAIERLQVVGEPSQNVRIVAVGCGAADELLDFARRQGCDAMVLGEARLHTCLEAQARGVGLLLPGHFASERFAVEQLAEAIARQFPDIQVWPSRRETDPLRWI